MKWIAKIKPWLKGAMFWSLGFLILFMACVQSASAREPTLLLFGGNNNDQFLGCLNCSRYDSSSVWNKYGEHGSKYNSNSIWNKYGEYGSKYNSHSPWNKYSSDAPVVVDPDGNFYGYFTRNKYNNQTKIKWLVWILDNYEYVMENFDEVRSKF